jgi:hypothetical protein
MKKNEVRRKKKNEAKKKIEKKKCITPVSSPEFIHVPSTAEKRREAKVARNQQYLNGKMCSGECKGLFDETNIGMVEGQLWIKPSVKAPVWVCQGLVNKSKCCQALCSECAKVMMSNGILK